MVTRYKKHAFPFVVFAGILGIIFWELAVLDFGPIKSLVSQKRCLSQSGGYENWTCAGPYFKELADKLSTATAMAEAIKLKEERVVADCHLFAHVIGETALEKYNFDTGEAFSSCISGCSDGCFHGVMERYIRDRADPYNAMSQVKNMCDSVGTDFVRKRQCIHGVGHGLIAHNALPLREAIDACEVFGLDWAAKCRGGLLMENMNQYLLVNLDEEGFKEAIPEVCAQIESIKPELMEHCTGSVALGLLYYTGYDLRRSEELCEELPNPRHADLCKNEIPNIVTNERPSVIKGF